MDGNFDLVSDLHLEFGDLILPGGEVLVIAGDLAEVRSFFRNDNSKARQIGKRLFRFMKEETGKYNHVLYVPGNHEYYGRSVQQTESLISEFLTPYVTFLRTEYVKINGINFWGATMWTDLNKMDPLVVQACRNAMSDYNIITHFSPQASADIHLDHLVKLKKFLLAHRNQNNVIITHHAPCIKSVREEYKRDIYINHAYYSDLSDILLDNKLTWVHGHTHGSFSYELGESRVFCNARGYAGYEKDADNYKPMRIEV